MEICILKTKYVSSILTCNRNNILLRSIITKVHNASDFSKLPCLYYYVIIMYIIYYYESGKVVL